MTGSLLLRAQPIPIFTYCAHDIMLCCASTELGSRIFPDADMTEFLALFSRTAARLLSII
jgi:hypothetical protein